MIGRVQCLSFACSVLGGVIGEMSDSLQANGFDTFGNDRQTRLTCPLFTS